MTEKDKKEIKGYIKKLVDHFDKQVKHIDKNSDDRFRGYVEDVSDRFKATAEGTAGIHQRLDKMQGEIDNVAYDVKEIRSKMISIEYTMNVSFERKADKKMFLELDSRVTKLEKK